MAFVVERSMKRNILDFNAVYERLCVLGIKTRFQNIGLIKVHAATEKREEMKKVFYEKVEEICDSCPSNDDKILLENWNANVGREEIYQGVIGRNSMHLNTNNNEQRLVDFAGAKTWWYPQPLSRTKKFIQENRDLQMEKKIIILTIY